MFGTGNRLVAIAFVLVIGCGVSSGQELSGYAGAFADVPVSARTAALGYARITAPRASDALFSNPAALISAGPTSLGFSYFRLYGLVPILSVSGARRIDAQTAVGLAALSNGDQLYRENTLLLGGSRLFFWKGRQLDLGASLGLRYGSFGKESATAGAVSGNVWGLGLSVGSRLWLTEHAVVAVSIQNLLNTLFWSSSASGSYTEGLPVSLSIGAGAFDLGGMAVVADLAKSLYREPRDRFHLGIEREFFSYTFLRAGYSSTMNGSLDEHVGFGIGIKYPFSSDRDVLFDIAYNIEDLPNTLRLTLGLEF